MEPARSHLTYQSAAHLNNRNGPSPSTEKDIELDNTNVRTIQIRCVLKVIEDSIVSVKSALLLPKLLKQPRIVEKVLTGTKYEPAIQLVEDYVRRRDRIVKEKRGPLGDIGMIRLIDYFQRNSAICDMFPNIHMTGDNRKLLVAFELLYKITAHHLLRSSQKEIGTERLLHKLFQENERYLANIKKLEDNLAKHVTQMRWKAALRNEVRKKCEFQLERQHKAHILRIENESERCQREIKENLKNSAENQKLLEVELSNLTAQYNVQTQMFQRDTKRIRDEKNKLQLQLETALRKYDRVMGEKIIEHLDTDNELKKEQKVLEDLMITYHKAEATYNAIVVKRDEEESFLKWKRIKKYRLNRAARKIQTYWRNWRKQLIKKKKRIAKRYTLAMTETINGRVRK